MLLSPLREPQLYERIAEELATGIRSGVFAPGSRLPSERELARHLQVGRSSVREAIAALATRGLVESRPGSGSYVTGDAADQLAAGETLNGSADISPSAMLDARLCIEPPVAELAARRGHRDAEVERLLELMERASDPANPMARADWSEADRLFHLQIAVLTTNPVLIGLYEQIAQVMDQPLWRRLRDESVAQPGRMTIHLAEHRMIYEAIADADPDAAGLYARRHIERVRRYMELT